MQIGGEGPPLLLIHGHPQTHAIRHRVAPRLQPHFTLMAADLRGYRDSSKPAGEDDHANYSKRTMATNQVTLTRMLRHPRFDVLAHDRGARVAHRLAMDHPKAVGRMVLLDGEALPCGHYIGEEAPEALLERVQPSLSTER